METDDLDPQSGITADTIEQEYIKLVFDSRNIEYKITSDIFNEQGTLLIPSGNTVDQTTYDKVLNHKLLKPIDEYIQFSNQITTDNLLDDLVALCEKLLADTVYDFDATIGTIRHILAECDYDNIVLNKLTVFSKERTDNFNHSLSTAFIAVEIGKSLDLTHNQLIDLFSAAMFHDIGEMFIDPAVYKKDILNNEEFRAIMVHPVVSQVILKESRTNFSAELLDAVLNHHEQLDGQGYPRGLPAARIGQYERILSVADTYDALQRKDRSQDDILWILKSQSAVNSITGDPISPTHDPIIVATLEKLIQKEQSRPLAADKLQNLKDLLQDLFYELLEVSHEIEHLWRGIEALMEDKQHTGQSSGALQRMHDELYKLNHLILGSSGINLVDFGTLSESEHDLIAFRRDLERLAPEMLNKVNVSRKYVSEHAVTVQDRRLASSVEQVQSKIHLFNRRLRKHLH